MTRWDFLSYSVIFVATVGLSELVRVLVLPKDIKSHVVEVLFNYKKKDKNKIKLNRN